MMDRELQRGAMLISRGDDTHRFTRDGASRGAALVIALMCMALMGVLGASLVLITSAERLTAHNFGRRTELFYAADAALERAIEEIQSTTNWDLILNGADVASFTDGPPLGARTLADGSTLDLQQLLNSANCGKATTCSSADMDAVTLERPWGQNNPRWQLYAYGNLAAMLPQGTLTSSSYIVVLVADDQSENDGDPLHDGASPTNPGSGILAIRALAFGARGARKTIEATVARDIFSGNAAIREVSWREIR